MPEQEQVPKPEQVPTGDAGVDAALDRLRELDPGAPPAEHLPVLTAVHEALAHRLSAAAE